MANKILKKESKETIFLFISLLIRTINENINISFLDKFLS